MHWSFFVVCLLSLAFVLASCEGEGVSIDRWKITPLEEACADDPTLDECKELK